MYGFPGNGGQGGYGDNQYGNNGPNYGSGDPYSGGYGDAGGGYGAGGAFPGGGPSQGPMGGGYGQGYPSMGNPQQGGNFNTGYGGNQQNMGNQYNAQPMYGYDSGPPGGSTARGLQQDSMSRDIASGADPVTTEFGDFDLPDGDYSVGQYAQMLMRGSDGGVFNSFHVDEAVGQRDLNSFDMNNLQNSYNELVGGSSDGSRGIIKGWGTGKVSKTHQVIAAAAAYTAVVYYQRRMKKQGKRVSHQRTKRILAAIAAAQAIRYVEKAGHLQGGQSREVVAQDAARSAMIAYDQIEPENTQPMYQYSQHQGQGEAATFDSFPV